MLNRIAPISGHRKLYVDTLKAGITTTNFVEDFFCRRGGASNNSTHTAGVIHSEHHIRSAGALSPHAGVHTT
jgi:hypothetical protein